VERSVRTVDGFAGRTGFRPSVGFIGDADGLSFFSSEAGSPFPDGSSTRTK